MNDKNELAKDDIRIDSDMDIDYNTGTIRVYIESWFDVDAKFGTHVCGNDDEWLDLFAEYTPTESEAKLVKEMIDECCRKYYGRTVEECVTDNESDIGMEGLS